MTPAAQRAAAEKELASRVLAKRRLLPFVQRINPSYKAGWVHHDVCRRLEKFSDDVIAGRSPRLMLLMPPRAGKSELSSRNFPAWHLGRAPDHEIINCSYNVGLAMTFSRKVKEVIDDPAYQTVFETRLNPNHQGAEEWSIAGHRGGYVAAGVGGGITGKGAHILGIDDPVKNAEEADSADFREKLWDWYGSTAYTRLSPGGGVLVTQCMTGDTPVLMADGTTRRLDELRPNDLVATYAAGELGNSRVRAMRSNGEDDILRITTAAGRVVRANARHPFLVSTNGVHAWMRASGLTTGHTIVAWPVNGVSGQAKPAPQTAACCLPSAAGCAPATTTKSGGLMATVRRALTRSHAALHTFVSAMTSVWRSTTGCMSRRAANALSACDRLPAPHLPTGSKNSASTTATTQAKCAGSCATTATSPSATLPLSRWHVQQRSTSDFTLDAVVSVEPAGRAEVFDVQVERTENFLAAGLVSHNTWWHDDDLAGRLQKAMKDDPEADQYVVVKYPAIAEGDEYLDHDTDLIVYDQMPEHGELLRMKGEALHPERYDLPKLNSIKRTLPKRFWSALYQQNPVPDDGGYFEAAQFRRGPVPHISRANVFVAFDFAISEKKQNDYTVGLVGLQDDDDVLHLADMVRFKSGDAFFIVESILNLCFKWYSAGLVLGVEDGQIWRSIEVLLKKRMRERKFYPSITVLKPITDKLARARPLQGRMQQGMVSFSDQGDWYDTARTEMLRFPAGVHDDIVDTAGWVAQLVVGRTAPQKHKAKAFKSWRDSISTGGSSGASHMAA